MVDVSRHRAIVGAHDLIVCPGGSGAGVSRGIKPCCTGGLRMLSLEDVGQEGSSKPGCLAHVLKALKIRCLGAKAHSP